MTISGSGQTNKALVTNSVTVKQRSFVRIVGLRTLIVLLFALAGCAVRLAAGFPRLGPGGYWITALFALAGFLVVLSV